MEIPRSIPRVDDQPNPHMPHKSKNINEMSRVLMREAYIHIVLYKTFVTMVCNECMHIAQWIIF